MENLLDEVNALIEEEHGEPIGWDDTIISSGIDSFGIIMVVLTISDKYDIWTKKEFGEINYARLTPKDILDKINESK